MRARVWAIGAAVPAVAALAVFWWLAVPRHDICGLTYPAPAGCNSDRVPLAALWSVIVVGFYAVGLYAAAKLRERRFLVVAALGLVVGTLWGGYAVLYA